MVVAICSECWSSLLFHTCWQLCICNSYVDDFTHLRQTWIFFQCLIKKNVVCFQYVSKLESFLLIFLIAVVEKIDNESRRNKTIVLKSVTLYLCSILIKLHLSDAIMKYLPLERGNMFGSFFFTYSIIKLHSVMP